jgi:carbonic anhydrase
MQHLIRGLHQFRNREVFRRKAFYKALANGQSPETLFITCSDSRIVTSLFTQTDPGRLFVVRNAGNIVPPYDAGDGGEAASIEYAVMALGVSDVVVCGHSDCGAMTAVANDQNLHALPAMERWLQHASATRERLHDNHADIHGDERVMAAVQENVLVQLDNLRTHPSVAKAVALGTLQLHGWVYILGTGVVLAYDDAAERFKPINKRDNDARTQPRDEMRASAGDIGG